MNNRRLFFLSNSKIKLSFAAVDHVDWSFSSWPRTSSGSAGQTIELNTIAALHMKHPFKRFSTWVAQQFFTTIVILLKLLLILCYHFISNNVCTVGRGNGDDDVTVKVMYCGVCHSDLHTLKNDWGFTMYPIVPGYDAHLTTIILLCSSKRFNCIMIIEGVIMWYLNTMMTHWKSLHEKRNFELPDLGYQIIFCYMNYMHCRTETSVIGLLL